MASRNVIGQEAAGGQSRERQVFDEDGFEVVDEVVERERNLRPTVEMEVQARVDSNVPQGTQSGLTLEAEERLLAREWEIERTRTRWDRSQTSDREWRTRGEVEQMSVERRLDFQRRAGSVCRWLDPDEPDPREQLTREELGLVNRHSMRMAEKLTGWSRVMISRLLAERLVEGSGIERAVLEVYEELQTAPGRVIPIEMVGDVSRREVDIEGGVTVLWEPSHSSISQVGLIEDGTGRVKFTIWKRSDQPMVREGQRVRFRDVKKNWYQGQCSVALTYESRIQFIDRGECRRE